MKRRRRVIIDRYAKEIEELYFLAACPPARGAAPARARAALTAIGIVNGSAPLAGCRPRPANPVGLYHSLGDRTTAEALQLARRRTEEFTPSADVVGL